MENRNNKEGCMYFGELELTYWKYINIKHFNKQMKKMNNKKKSLRFDLEY